MTTFADMAELLVSWPEPPDAVPLRILGLGPDHRPSRELVKHAFRAKVMAAHPDLRPECWDTSDAAGVQELVWARNVLLRKIPAPVTADDIARREAFNRNAVTPEQFPRRDPFTRNGGWCKICKLKWGCLSWRRPWYGYCWRCKNDAKKARQRDLRAQARADRTCENCGAAFTPARADGRFCSGACRQAMYRKRNTTNGKEPSA